MQCLVVTELAEIREADGSALNGCRDRSVPFEREDARRPRRSRAWAQNQGVVWNLDAVPEMKREGIRTADSSHDSARPGTRLSEPRSNSTRGR